MERPEYGAAADRIEAELTAVGAWGSPAPPGPVTSAFGMRDMAFTQWLEHVLCARLREVAAGQSEPPPSSSVAAVAVREFDGQPAYDGVIAALGELDRLVEG